MKSLFDVGDTVTLIQNYHSGYGISDYHCGLSIDTLDNLGGIQGTITEVINSHITSDQCPKLWIEPYYYKVGFLINSKFFLTRIYSAMMFQECSFITPGRENWDVLWTRRYSDIIFYRIKKNANVDLKVAHSLSGCFIFDATPEGGDFWDKVNCANVKQLEECITWLMANFPQDFFITASTTFINNFTINQNENQLQGTKIDLGRDENQRGTICVYPKDRPRVTICPISYTTVGYRNGVKISRCKD